MSAILAVEAPLSASPLGSAWDTEWVLGSEAVDRQPYVLMFVSLNTIIDAPTGERSATVMTIMYPDQDGVNGLTARRDFDCTGNRHRLSAGTSFLYSHNNGKIGNMKDVAASQEWAAAKPGTSIKSVLDVVCGNKDPLSGAYADPLAEAFKFFHELNK